MLTNPQTSEQTRIASQNNDYRKELARIFDSVRIHAIDDIPIKYIGRCAFVTLSETQVLKAQFVGERVGNYCYDMLKLFIINKLHGEIDSVKIPFPAYSPVNGGGKYRKTLELKNENLRWNCTLTDAELTDIRSQIDDYVNMFRTRH